MYRELIEGAAFLPPQVLKHIGVKGGIDKGRIYRIVPEEFKPRKPPRLSKATTAELVALLEHPNGWHRDTASRLLYERQDSAAVAPLKKLAVGSKSPLARVHALYALDGLKTLDAALVLAGLNDAEPRVREHALRLAERFESSPAIRAKLDQLTDDPDLRVRYQLAFSLGAVPGAMPSRALVRLALHDGKDSWVRLAILSSLSDRAGEVFRLLMAEKAFRAARHGREFLGTLAGQIGAANRQHDVAAVVKALNEVPETEKVLTQEIVRNLIAKQPAAGRAQLIGVAGGKASAIFADLLRDARQTANDPKRDENQRATAIRTLGLAEF